jgi:hypothetical protein
MDFKDFTTKPGKVIFLMIALGASPIDARQAKIMRLRKMINVKLPDKTLINLMVKEV